MLVRTGKNDIGSFLVILFCTVVISSTTGYSFGIRNSFAQQELQTQQPSTVTELPWSNNLSTFDTGNTQHHNIVISSIQTFVNSKNIGLNHAFVSNKVFIALFTASLTSLATCSSIPRVLARSDTVAFSNDLSVKLLLNKSSFNPSAMSSWLIKSVTSSFSFIPLNTAGATC